jgi:DNA-binding PucR family transcriptional regulator
MAIAISRLQPSPATRPGRLDALELLVNLPAGHQDQLARFADGWVGRLLEHDELAHTLRVLLETGGPSAAAATLFVHVSTLKYRVRKIESILGVDISNPEVCFNLRLAFKILALQERVSGSRA